MAVRLDADRLRELIAEQHEYEGLDYKSTSDPRNQRDLVELAKDIAAMSAEGGYVVVGSAGDGTAVGIEGNHVRRDFDEARLRGQLRRWLPEIDLRCAVHDLEGLTVALIWVGGHPDGFAIMAADGQYQDEAGNVVTVFREADVWVRRGSSSIRASYQDMVQLRRRLGDRVRTMSGENGRQISARSVHPASTGQSSPGTLPSRNSSPTPNGLFAPRTPSPCGCCWPGSSLL